VSATVATATGRMKKEATSRHVLRLQQQVLDLASSCSMLASIIDCKPLSVTAQPSPPRSPQLHARTARSSPAEPRVTPETGDLLEHELGLLRDVTKEAELALKTSTQECADIQQAYRQELAREQQFLERVQARSRAKAQREEAAQRKFAGVPTGVLRVKQQVHGVQGVGARPCVARERLYVPYVSGFLKYSESQSSASLKLQAVVRGHAGRKAFRAYRSMQELQEQKLLTYTPRCITSVLYMQRALRQSSFQRRKRQEMEEGNAGMNDSYTFVGMADINIRVRTMSLGGDVRHVKLVPAAINRAFVSQLDMTEVPCLRIDAAGACCRITPHGIEPSRASWPNEKAEHCEGVGLARERERERERERDLLELCPTPLPCSQPLMTQVPS
jgi:hypothetical protein